MPTNITALVLDALGTMGTPPATADELTAMLQQWRAFFGTTATSPSTTAADLTVWSTALATLLAAPDRAQELSLVQQASDNPLLGLLLVMACMPGTAKRQAQRWWDLLSTEQGANGLITGWKIKNLPPPATGRKYLIISDLHRDAASDDRGLLTPGSIHHFKKNAALYERILDSVIADGSCTLIEAGDCEELWFVRSVADYPKQADGSLDIGAKLQEILGTYPNVYAKLRQLHYAGRYLRIYGNHDSFLKKVGTDDSIGQVLRTVMEQRPAGVTTTVPFEIYDGFIIDGVKTMMEHDVLELGGDIVDLVTQQKTLDQFVNGVLQGRLGLDSLAYTEKRRMLVTHGHQFDVWNSPDNEILGLLIANTVATFVDRNMDPFLDLRGIALEGNPLVNFGDVFSHWMIFNCWPARMAAVRFAHGVQHTPNDQRLLHDSIMFSESVATLYGTFGIALNWVDAAGNEVTPAQSRTQLDLTTPRGLMDYLSRHHLHHMCIGHTHNPHSQPAITLQNLATVAMPLAPVIKKIQSALPDFLEPQVKTMYFNSGTAGWMEGVIWGIEIDEEGQARLVFWTDNSLKPEYMDWELQPLPAAIRNNLLQGLTTALGAPVTEVEQYVEDIYTLLKNRLAALNVSPAASAAALARSTIVPVYALALSLMSSASASGLHLLKEVPKGLQGRLDALRDQFDQIRSFTIDVLLTMKRRALRGFTSNAQRDQHVIRAPISPGARSRLDRFKRILKSMGMSESEALHYGGLLLSVFDDFPRNLPFFSTLAEPLYPPAPLEESDTPVLHALLATLWMYPPQGQTVVVGDVAMNAAFAVDGTSVTLTVTIEKNVGGIV